MNNPTLSAVFNLNSYFLSGVPINKSYYLVDRRLIIAGFEVRFIQIGVVVIWNSVNGKVLSAIKAHNEAITDLLVDEDKSFIYTASSSGSVKMWNLSVN